VTDAGAFPTVEAMSDIAAHPAPADASTEPEGQLYEHDMDTFSSLDRGYMRSVAFGYLGGVLAIFAFMFLTISVAAPDIPMPAKVGVAIGVAFWIGIMGGVVAVGMWARKHEHELFH
jgi:hypothetical protein